MSDPEPSTIDRGIIGHLINGAAPERSNELQRLWAEYDPSFQLRPDCHGLVFSAKKERINFTNKTLSHDWLIGFAAWKAFVAYGPVIVTAEITGQPLSIELLQQDAGLNQAEGLFEEALYDAQQIRAAASLEEVPWRHAVPRPQPDAVGLSLQDRAAFEILCIAEAGLFLHEMRHVQYARENNSPVSWPDEERACDKFARDFLLSESERYAQSVGKPTPLILAKRTVGLGVSAYIIYEQTPSGDRGGSATHPPVIARFDELAINSPCPADSYAWVFLSALLLAALRRERRFKRGVTFSSPKELCIRLTDMLAENGPA
jgi:hypothetical protein